MFNLWLYFKASSQKLIAGQQVQFNASQREILGSPLCISDSSPFAKCYGNLCLSPLLILASTADKTIVIRTFLAGLGNFKQLKGKNSDDSNT